MLTNLVAAVDTGKITILLMQFVARNIKIKIITENYLLCLMKHKNISWTYFFVIKKKMEPKEVKFLNFFL